MSSVLGGVLIPDGTRCVSSANGNLTVAVLSPGGMFVSGNKREKEVDVNPFHISLAHAHVRVLKATVQQHEVRLAGTLTPYLGCSQAKGTREAISHHTTARAQEPMELINIDTAGPYPESRD